MNIRALRYHDRATINRFIATDAEHTAKGMTADFFFPEPPKHPTPMDPCCQVKDLALCFEDDAGPVFYMLLATEAPDIRLHIQFDENMTLRTVRMLKQAYEVVKEKCRQAGAHKMVFDSINGPLRTFCMNHFGFQPVSGTADLEYTLGLPSGEDLDKDAEEKRIKQATSVP